MKLRLILILPLFFVFCAYAQENDDVTEIIRAGIVLHDEGKYEEAIKKYEEALVLRPDSKMALYEMCFSYQMMKEYQKVVECATKALEVGEVDENLDPVIYMTLGSAYDDLNEPFKAIEAFDKGIEINESINLLHFNKGLTYHRMDSIQQAFQSYKEGLYIKMTHPSSNLNVARIYLSVNDIVSAFLYYTYFLILEPNTERSRQALEEIFSIGKSNNITLPGNTQNILHLNLTMAFLASNAMERDVNEIKMTPFKKMEQAFKIICETKSEVDTESLNDDICSYYLAPLIFAACDDGQIETLCRYITISVDEESANWIEENPNKINSLFMWINALGN